LEFFARNEDDNPARKAILLFETIGGVVLVIFIFIYMDLTLFSPWEKGILSHYFFVKAINGIKYISSF
jgi:hypothetical protein